jgi:hypothetical protein
VVSRNFVAARHPFRKRVSGCIKHVFLPPEPFLRFSQRTCPIRYFRSKTHVWGGFAQFRYRTSPISKTGVGVHKSTSFCHRNHFFVFRNEHAQYTTLGPKPMFGVVVTPQCHSGFSQMPNQEPSFYVNQSKHEQQNKLSEKEFTKYILKSVMIKTIETFER